MSIIIREFERKIVRMTIDAVLAAGRKAAWNHDSYIEDDDTFYASDSSEETLDDAFACNDLRLWVDPLDFPNRGWIWFVFGSNGYDVISDYTTNIEELLKPINDYCDKYA